MPSLGIWIIALFVVVLVYAFYRAFRILHFFDAIHVEFNGALFGGDTDLLRAQIGRAIVETVQQFNQRAQFLLLRARSDNTHVRRLKEEFAQMSAYTVFRENTPNMSLSLRVVSFKGSWHAEELFEHEADQHLWNELAKELKTFSGLVHDSFGIAMHLKASRSS